MAIGLDVGSCGCVVCVYFFIGLQILWCGILGKRVQEFMLKWHRNLEKQLQKSIEIQIKIDFSDS